MDARLSGAITIGAGAGFVAGALTFAALVAVCGERCRREVVGR